MSEKLKLAAAIFVAIFGLFAVGAWCLDHHHVEYVIYAFGAVLVVAVAGLSYAFAELILDR